MTEKEQTEQTYYSVSEAVQKTGTPSHVLRYWEEELQLAIGRTGQGHRIYSEEDIRVFRRVKQLKDSGIQLKAIRLLLKENGDAVTEDVGLRLLLEAGAEPVSGAIRRNAQPETGGCPEEGGLADAGSSENKEKEHSAYTEKDTGADAGAQYEVIPTAEADNLSRFEALLRSLIREVVEQQNEKLERAFEAALREELEELYLQLCQEIRNEAAASELYRPGAEKKAQTGTDAQGIRGLLRRLQTLGRRK